MRRHHAHLCFYILATTRAARSSSTHWAVRWHVVICRVLIDAFGSRPSRRTLLPKLRALGVRSAWL